MTTRVPPTLNWRKATASQGSQGCVELASLPDALAIRDSKDPEGPRLLIGPNTWHELVKRVNGGELDPS